MREVFIPPAVQVRGFVSPSAAAPAELDVLRAVDRTTETANGRTKSAIRAKSVQTCVTLCNSYGLTRRRSGAATGAPSRTR